VSLDGKRLAVGTEDGVVHVHDAATTNELGTFVGHGTAVVSLCFVGMDRLCSGSDDGQLCVWDVDRQYRIHSVQGHGRRLAEIVVSPDFMSFVTVGWDCKIKVAIFFKSTYYICHTQRIKFRFR
jgi:WD40 repeat protein